MQKPPMGVTDEASNVSCPVSESAYATQSGRCSEGRGKAGKLGKTLPLEGCKFGTLDVI